MINLKKIFLNFYFVLLAASTFISCGRSTTPEAAEALQSIIPKPVKVTPTGKMFLLTDDSNVFVEGESPELANIARYLTSKLNPSTGFDLSVTPTTGAPAAGNIYLTLGGDTELGNEGYLLSVTEDMIKVTANQAAGLFRGVQTIRQLFPAKIESGVKQELS